MASKTIRVKVYAGAKTEKVEEVAPDTFKVRVQSPPQKGKANIRVAELLAEYFKVPIRNITLQRGATFREKIFHVEI